MNTEIELDIEALKKACESLKKAYDIYLNEKINQDLIDIYADSCVKRFEYTYETAWKIMKKYFKLQYNKKEEDLTINNIFRYMESYGFAKSWLSWKEYNSQRNNTAHEYNLAKARKLIDFIPNLLEDVNFLLNKWDSL